MNPFTRLVPRSIVAVFAAMLLATAAQAQSISLGATPYLQDFDTLESAGPASTLPGGWSFSESGTNANTTYGAGTGSSNAGDTYSFGASGSTDRAFGTLLSGSLTPTIGARFTNATGATIVSLEISYVGEQWRLGALNRTDRLDFQYSLDATSLATGTWIDADALDFTAPVTTGAVGALNGNAAPNRTVVSATLTGLAIAPGATFWVRWTDFNAPGADDGLAVDDFRIAAQTGTVVDLPISATATPAGINTTPGAAASSALVATDPDSVVNGASITSAPVAGITLAGFVPSPADGGNATATLEVAAAVAPGNYAVVVTFTNNDGGSLALTVPVTVAASVRIRDIQGAAHVSPMNGMTVLAVPGVVTALAANGFYMQDPSPDANPATSEGIFVFTDTSPPVTVGSEVRVNGTVQEFRPGGSPTNLTITQIGSPAVQVIATGVPLPPPVVIGIGGRVPPSQVIYTGAGNVETTGTFDPATDGIDFYESLEGMRVQINDALVVGPTNSFGEVWVVGDGGANAGLRTPRGGVIVQPGDFNPERIQIDDGLIGVTATPQFDVGATLQTIVGVVSYAFGNYEVLATQALVEVASPLRPEITELVAQPERLTVASYNVENLDPSDGAAKFNALAAQIVTNLRSPDIVAAIEVQDNNGPTNDAVVDASTTLQTLIDAIVAAGGPTYRFRQVNPVDDQDGGEPGGNIRVAFLYNPARVHFVDRAGGGPTVANAVVNASGEPQLAHSPGRIDPTNAAFQNSRKPLAGEFLFNGQRLFVIANHFNSKGGDQPLFGPNQPPVLSTEIQRLAQASVVRDFVQQILAVDANANVVVLGDLNDFDFSPPLAVLRGAGLTPLADTLPANERYTYVFDGNSQALDHILASASLAAVAEYDVVHVNAEFARQTSDHDPEVARFFLPRPDLTASLAISASGPLLDRRSGNFSQRITLANNGAAAVNGPLLVAFDNLPAGVTLANAQGTVGGRPFIELAGPVAAGTAATLTATFTNPTRVPLDYSLRILRGPL